MPRAKPDQPPMDAATQQTIVTDGIDNFELPKSVVMKIAKSALPDNVKLQKETVHALVKGSTVFINYLAASAHGVAQTKQHKSISASDVIRALEMIEFPLMAERIQPEAALYRQKVKSDTRPKKSASNGGASSSGSKKSKSKGKEKAGTGSSASTATGGGISINIPPLSGVSSSASTAGGPYTSSPLDLNAGSISTPAVNKMGQHGSSSLRTGVTMLSKDEDPDATEDDRMDVDEEASVSTGPNSRLRKPSSEDVDAGDEPVESEVDEAGDDDEVDEEDEVDENGDDDEVEDDDEISDKEAMDDEDLTSNPRGLGDD